MDRALTPTPFSISFSGKNFFLVGDAARFTDPLSGAGIANGIKSGVMAARNAVLRLHGKKDTYVKEVKREILDEISLHFRIRNFYMTLTDQECCEVYQIGKGIIGGKTVDDLDVKHLAKAIIKSSPRLLKLSMGKLF